MLKKILLLVLQITFLFHTTNLFSQTKVVDKKFDNGKPEIISYYKGGQSDNNLTKRERYGMDGKLVREENYLYGHLNGAVKAWKEFDGSLTMELNYKTGKLDGKQFYYFSNGKPQTITNYLDGQMEGPQYEFHFKDGPDSLKSEHNYSGGIPHGMQRKWRKDGSKEYNLNFVAGKPDGIQRWWDESGQMKEEKWKQGVFEEVVEGWSASQPKHTRVYDYSPKGDSLSLELGKLIQKEMHYFETSSIEAITIMTDPPETQEFHVTGKPRGKGQGTFEKKIGKWEYWHENGQKMMEGEYKEGKKTGLFRSWDDKGNITSEEVWDPSGSKIESWKIFLYHSNGKVQSEGNLDDQGRRKGLWKYWYTNGNKEREETWEINCKSGGRPFLVSFTEWDQSGKIMKKGSEKEYQTWEYYPNGNAYIIKTEHFPFRNECDKGPVEAFSGGVFRKVEPPVENYIKSTVVEEISFQENGDTMKIDRFNVDGKRDGQQVGWFGGGKKHYIFTYKDGAVNGMVKEWYDTGQLMLDHTYKSTSSGIPELQKGIYYKDNGKEYEYDVSEGKKKKVMEEIDMASYFQRFWQEHR